MGAKKVRVVNAKLAVAAALAVVLLVTVVFGRLIYRDAFGDRAATGFGYLLRGGTALPLSLAAYNYRKSYGPGDGNAPHVYCEL